MYFIFSKTEKSLISFEFSDCILLITYSILHIVIKLNIPMVETLSKILTLKCATSVINPCFLIQVYCNLTIT